MSTTFQYVPRTPPLRRCDGCDRLTPTHWQTFEREDAVSLCPDCHALYVLDGATATARGMIATLGRLVAQRGC